MILQAIAGASVTQHCDPGGDLGVIANLPVGESGHALRLVGYMLSDGGYIDNPLRGQTDVNRVDTRGGRGNFRFDAGDGWTVDIGGVYQVITAHDSQSAHTDTTQLTRHTRAEESERSV